MKLRFKLAMLTFGAGLLLQFGNCARFWGDALGDALFYRQLD
jgi:hypothetical protein